MLDVTMPHAHLICRKPRDPPIEPANLDRLNLSPAVSGLELDHPLRDRLPPTEEPIFPISAAPTRIFPLPVGGWMERSGGAGSEFLV